MFHRLLMQENKPKEYIQDGLVYQGDALDIPVIYLPNGEFTVEIVNELLKLEPNSGSYKRPIRFFDSTDTSNQFGSLKSNSSGTAGLMLYYTKGDSQVISVSKQYATVGDKRTTTFLFTSANVKKFYYNANLMTTKQASSTFGSTKYDNVAADSLTYYDTYNIRIYDRALTADEILYNYQLDKEVYGI